MKILLLCNPAAGRGRALRAATAARECLEARGIATRLVVSESREHLTSLARTANGQWDRVVVAGGDGTVHYALRDLDLSSTILGLLPFGSGDDLARTLDVPRDVDTACDVLIHGEVRRIDVALANDVRYVGIAGLGLDSEVARRVNENPRPMARSLVYIQGLLQTLPSFQAKEIFIESEGRLQTERVMFAVVANNCRYGGGIEIAPTARMDDRLLDLHVIRECTRWKLLRTMPRSYRGRHLDSGVVWWQQGARFSIDADEPLDVYADGEYVTQTPVDFRLEALPLMVMAPRQA